MVESQQALQAEKAETVVELIDAIKNARSPSEARELGVKLTDLVVAERGGRRAGAQVGVGTQQPVV
jgi:hypothetical protein